MKPKINNSEIKRCYEIEFQELKNKSLAVIRTAKKFGITIDKIHKAIK